MKIKLSMIIWAVVVATLGVLWAASKQPILPSPTSSSTSAASCNLPMAGSNTTAADKVPDHPYPFATSIVSGLKLGGSGTGVTLEQNDYEVRLANQAEADTFKKNPAPYLATIESAYKSAKPCPMTVCPVMGDPLDKDAYAFVYEGRQFKLCCDSCLDDFQKSPAKYVKMWDDAAQTVAADKK